MFRESDIIATQIIALPKNNKGTLATKVRLIFAKTALSSKGTLVSESWLFRMLKSPREESMKVNIIKAPVCPSAMLAAKVVFLTQRFKNKKMAKLATEKAL